MQITSIAQKRYATKSFDATKKISPSLLEDVKRLLQLSPSSVNAQPWHFLLTGSEEGKKRMARSTEDLFSFNKEKLLNASHVVVFCSRTDLDESYLQKLTEQEAHDGRFASPEDRAAQHQKRAHFSSLHKGTYHDLALWTAKQVYLNVGAFLLGVAALGIDAVPLEGFDNQALDREFGLERKNLKSEVIVPIGFHAEDDFNFRLPKSRLPLEVTLTEF